MFGNKKLAKELKELKEEMVSLRSVLIDKVVELEKTQVVKELFEIDGIKQEVTYDTTLTNEIKRLKKANKKLMKDNTALFAHNKQLLGSDEDYDKKIKCLEHIVEKFDQYNNGCGQITVFKKGKTKVIDIDNKSQLEKIIKKAKKGTIRILG